MKAAGLVQQQVIHSVIPVSLSQLHSLADLPGQNVLYTACYHVPLSALILLSVQISSSYIQHRKTQSWLWWRSRAGSVSLGESIPTTVMRSGSDAFHICECVWDKQTERNKLLVSVRSDGSHEETKKRKPSLKPQPYFGLPHQIEMGFKCPKKAAIWDCSVHYQI